jgi:hypothetical protein
MDGGRGSHPEKGRDVEIPNWLKWLALAGLVIWLITDPKGLASFLGDAWDSVLTFFRELG